jgi:nitrile hydratase
VDGIHDLAGMDGFGAIEVERDEPVFHERWEAVAFAINALMIGAHAHHNADEYRHAIERMAPAHYLSASYYERVLTGVATLLVEKGTVEVGDLEQRAGGLFPLARPSATAEDDGRSEPSAPRFAVGDRVRVRRIHPPGHTRVPRYVRGVEGEVLHVAPAFSFPDRAAHGLSLRSEPTYHVAFEAGVLWPEDPVAGDEVVVDLWETYLEEVR